MTDDAGQRVRLMRYELYSRAVDSLRGSNPGDVLPTLTAQTHGCKRAAEAIELAEFHVAFRFPKRGIEHFVRQLGRCSDCQRARCAAADDAAALGCDPAATPEDSGSAATVRHAAPAARDP